MSGDELQRDMERLREAWLDLAYILVKAWPMEWAYPDEKVLLQAGRLKAFPPPLRRRCANRCGRENAGRDARSQGS